MLEQFLNQTSANFSLQTIGIILALVSLEAALSADNDVALAAIVNAKLDEPNQQRALNWGLLGAFGLRIILIFCAS